MGAVDASYTARVAEWSPASIPLGKLPNVGVRSVGPTTQRRMANGVEAAVRDAGFALVYRAHLPDGRGTVVGERDVRAAPLPAGDRARRLGPIALGGAGATIVGVLLLVRLLPGGFAGVLLVVLGLSIVGYASASYLRVGRTFESDLVEVSFRRAPPAPEGMDPYQAGPAEFPTRVSTGRARSFDQSSREPGRDRTRGVWSIERGAPELQTLPGELVRKLPGEAPSFDSSPTPWVGGGPGDEGA